MMGLPMVGLREKCRCSGHAHKSNGKFLYDWSGKEPIVYNAMNLRGQVLRNGAEVERKGDPVVH